MEWEVLIVVRSNGQVSVEYMPLSSLRGAVRNPKDHDIGELGQSLERFGYVTPMLVNEATGRLVVGHGRRDALMGKKARGEAAPERVVVGDDGEWYVPVIRGVSFGTEEEAEAFLLADNRLSEIGGWHEPTLVDVLKDLAVQGQEMLAGIGFDVQDLDQMLARMDREIDLEDVGDGGLGEDGILRYGTLEEAEKLLEKWPVEEGQVWRVGGHYVMCGDCRDEYDWQVLTRAAGVDRINGIVTSPPYADRRERQYGGVPPEDYVQWWEQVQVNAAQYLLDNGSFFVNIKAGAEDGQRLTYVMEMVLAMVDRWGWKLIEEFAWERISAPGSWPNRFKNGWEPVYQFALGTGIKFRPKNVAMGPGGQSRTAKSNKQMGNYYNTVGDRVIQWEAALPSTLLPTFGNATGTAHAAAYPVGLPEFFVKAYSDYGDVWLDPFAGSGTTGEACHKAGRIALLMEILPPYAAVCIERLHSCTASQPQICT